MKRFKIGILFILMSVIQSVAIADTGKKYYYSVAKYAFDFASNKAVLHEYYVNFRDKNAVTDKIISIDFSARTFETVSTSVDTLSPVSIDPSQSYVMFNQQSKKRAVIFDLIKNEVVVTKTGEALLVQWNDQTKRFYLMVNNSGRSSYEYDLKDEMFMDAAQFEFVTKRDSAGDYRLEYFADDMDSIWTIVEKVSGKKVMDIFQSNGYSKQDLVWNKSLDGFWFYPHSTLVDINKSETRNFLEEKKWRDIAHNDRFIFVHDQGKDLFHIVNAATGDLVKSYPPFWRKDLPSKK